MRVEEETMDHMGGCLRGTRHYTSEMVAEYEDPAGILEIWMIKRFDARILRVLKNSFPILFLVRSSGFFTAKRGQTTHLFCNDKILIATFPCFRATTKSSSLLFRAFAETTNISSQLFRYINGLVYSKQFQGRKNSSFFCVVYGGLQGWFDISEYCRGWLADFSNTAGGGWRISLILQGVVGGFL
jgi:hypothetical protein